MEASGLVDAIVDPVDPFDGPYTLDVSSLGAEKPIPVEKLEKARGKKCYLHLSHPFEGENELTGLIEDVDEESVKLILTNKGRKKKVELERRYVDRAHLAV